MDDSNEGITYSVAGGHGGSVGSGGGRKASARDLSDEELTAELARRGKVAVPARCPCGKWGTYVGSYDADGYTQRCHGCLRAVGKCTCR